MAASEKINFSYYILLHLITSYSSYFGGKKGISGNKTSFFLLMATGGGWHTEFVLLSCIHIIYHLVLSLHLIVPAIHPSSVACATHMGYLTSAKINFSYSILFHLTTSYSSYFGGKKGISRNKTSFFLLMTCCKLAAVGPEG